MPAFGKNSRVRRDSCSEHCKEVLDEAIKHFDFSIIWGHRNEKEQNLAYEFKHSRLQWPKSKHNELPSKAFDIVPYPEGYESSKAEFYEMASYVLEAASLKGYKFKWGGHWKNYTGKGEDDRDWAHFEEAE